MKPQYEPKTVEQALGYLVEECGEVLAAVGKTQRWGLESTNPEIPIEKQETNRDWILRELCDLELAIERARKFLGFVHRGPSSGPMERVFGKDFTERYQARVLAELQRSLFSAARPERQARRRAIIELSVELDAVRKQDAFSTAFGKLAIDAVIEGNWQELRELAAYGKFEEESEEVRARYVPLWKSMVDKMLAVALEGETRAQAAAWTLPKACWLG